ncbi:MAG: signal peptidase I [Ilumatobacter sp.]|nr:signal peptidase I [Ilumatobacter sp.]
MTELSDPPFDPPVGHGNSSPAVATVGGPEREPPTASKSGLSPGARAFFDWIVVVGVALLVAVLVRTFLLAHFVVEGTSMYSTLDTGDRVFVNKMSYRLHDPNRGDVVVLHELTGTTERDLIKRVIALPGEEVRMENCQVFIDQDPDDELPAQRLIEPYLDPEVVSTGRCGSQIEPQVVEDGHVYVLGDNRAGSQDSRALGQIEFDDLVGRAFVVFWPRSSWQWL